MTSARGEAKCTDVHFRYGRSEALSGFTATFARGMTGLLGPNGAGKSTLFSVLTTLARPQSGAVMVGGLDVASQSDQVRQIIGFLPQRFDLLGWQSVRRNVEYAAWARGLSPDESREATDATISKLGLTAYAGTRPGRCPVDIGSVWGWRAPLLTTQKSCCWTSRRSVSTRSPALSCVDSLANSPRRRPSLPPTSWRMSRWPQAKW